LEAFMRRWLLTFVLVLLPAAGFAQTQVPSVRDIISLSKAGLSEDVLLALIEVNGSVYPTDAETLKGLKAGGVSPAVIVAMVRSGRQTPKPEPPPVQQPEALDQPQPQVVVVEREAREPETRVIREVLPVPVYVAVPTPRYHRPGVAPRRVEPAEPVYWGFGGKLRPDAWKPTAADVQKDAKIPPAQKK
jgi:hypothetical protein